MLGIVMSAAADPCSSCLPVSIFCVSYSAILALFQRSDKCFLWLENSAASLADLGLEIVGEEWQRGKGGVWGRAQQVPLWI